jgi:DeoR/GlpR family transcriptional regulator of sugar metabolism
MIKNQRQQQIIDLIKENGSCTVQNLSKMFSVSEPTIRTDLRALEKDGSIIRQHGGAFLKQNTLHSVNLTLEDRGYNEEKRRIARKALEYVHENDNIILDSGTTVTALADELVNVKPLQILTNSINIGFQLSNSPNNVVMLGGEIKKPTLSLTGSIGISMLNGVMADSLFLATGGLDIEVGLSLPSFNDVELKKAMIESAKQVILLADSSKIGKVRFAAMGCLDKIDIVITDNKINPEIKIKLEELGIKVITC